MSLKLKDRIISYQNNTDYRILEKLPLIIKINGRNFSKVTSLLNKPYDSKFAEGMTSVLFKLCSEVEGVLFGYYYNDEIIILCQNDQNNETEPWFNNKIQKISSVTASMGTIYFNNYIKHYPLNIIGDPIFSSQIFGVPNIAEAINAIIFYQQQNFHISIQSACFYELLKKYDKNMIREMLSGLNIDEKIDLLNRECEIKFNEYPLSFKRGIACYRIPDIGENGIKSKWVINGDLPIFTKEQSFLTNIVKNNGVDIFRNFNL